MIVDGNHLGFDGAKVLAPLLKEWKALRDLWLGIISRDDLVGENDVNPEGCKLIATTLPELTGLTTLDLCIALQSVSS